ncbi:hypothetical protein BLNAU_24165 [Blattamonas nauphoetae]|uniref:Uncharacterized protein n=1 Tax=Blattamonas nauphoetae TaxID=2049346 RepID=A0ABQ9WN58_9EUKA|nr:hypothetical protein BLNAU_24165 [Blattamonas nauphoetae]
MLPHSPFFEECDFTDSSPSPSTLTPETRTITPQHTRQLSQPVSETSTAFDEVAMDVEDEESDEEHNDTYMSFLQLHLDLITLSSLLVLSFTAFSTCCIDPPTTPSPNKTNHSDSSRFKSTRLSFSFRCTQRRELSGRKDRTPVGRRGEWEEDRGNSGTFRRWRDERKKNESPNATSFSVGQSDSTDPSLPPSPQAFLAFLQKHPPTFCARVMSLDTVLIPPHFSSTHQHSRSGRGRWKFREGEEKMLTEQCIERGWCGGSDSEALREERG